MFLGTGLEGRDCTVPQCKERTTLLQICNSKGMVCLEKKRKCLGFGFFIAFNSTSNSVVQLKQ